MASFFSSRLVAWYNQNKRPLPWRETTDPYRIWLSEIILQQTQVNQGLSYYNAFISKYPSVTHLAKATEDEVLKMWQGLGYYSRARNLLAAARFIAEKFSGVFPSTYSDIRQLKGVGDYTAAAVASFAFELPHAVVDGNVYRLLARYFGLEVPTDTSAGKKVFSAIARQELDLNDPATHNQATMEFGSQYCRPANPECFSCVLSDSCAAFNTGKVSSLPVKSKAIRVRTRHFNYAVITDEEGRVRISRRNGKDIWQGLYEFDLIESEKQMGPETFFELDQVREACGGSYEVKHISPTYTHVLTHQRLHTRFYVLQAKTHAPGAMVPASELHRYAFPVLITRFMADCDLKEMF